MHNPQGCEKGQIFIRHLDTWRCLSSAIDDHLCYHSSVRNNCLFGIRCISTGVGGGALRKRQMLSSIKAVVRPSVMVTEKQMEEKMER